MLYTTEMKTVTNLIGHKEESVFFFFFFWINYKFSIIFPWEYFFPMNINWTIASLTSLFVWQNYVRHAICGRGVCNLDIDILAADLHWTMNRLPSKQNLKGYF